jgi:hypothetical protein
MGLKGKALDDFILSRSRPVEEEPAEDLTDEALDKLIMENSTPVEEEEPEIPEYPPLGERGRFTDLPTGNTATKIIDPALREILQQSRPDEIIDYFVDDKLSVRKQLDLKKLRAKGRVNGRSLVTLPQALKDINSIALQPESIKPQSWGKVFKRALKNTPRSSAQLIKDIIAPFLSPGETAYAMYRLSKGMGQKLIPGIQEDEHLVNSLVAMFKKRYGGIENFKETLATDPAGVAADISTFLLGAGFVTRAVAKTGKLSRLQKVGVGLKKAGEKIEPLTALTRGAKTVVGAVIPEKAPSWLYQNAVKFSRTIPRKQRDKLAKTALTERILPTVRSLDKLENKIGSISDKVFNIFEKATAEGRPVPIRQIFKHLRELKRKQFLSGSPMTNIKIINKVRKEVIDVNKEYNAKGYLTPSEVLEFKQNIYKEVESLYEATAEQTMIGVTKKEMARGAKDILEAIAPETKALNKRNKGLIELHKALEQAVAHLTGRDLIDLRATMRPAQGVSGKQGFNIMPYVTLGLIGSPKVKAKLAIVAESLIKQGVILDPNSVLSQVLAKTPKGVPLTLRGITQATKNGAKNGTKAIKNGEK